MKKILKSIICFVLIIPFFYTSVLAAKNVSDNEKVEEKVSE